MNRVQFGGLLLCIFSAGTPAASSLTLVFTPDRTLETGTPGIYNCYNEPAEAQGSLEAPSGQGACHSGKLGVAAGGEIAGPAEFTSPAFGHSLKLAGPTNIVTHTGNLDASGSSAEQSSLQYELHEILANGGEALIASGTAIEDFEWYGRHEGAFDIGAYTVAPGSRLRLRLGATASTTSRADLLFGGDAYGDSGVKFAIQEGSSSDPVVPEVGALSPIAVLVLAGLFAARRRRVRSGRRCRRS